MKRCVGLDYDALPAYAPISTSLSPLHNHSTTTTTDYQTTVVDSPMLLSMAICRPVDPQAQMDLFECAT